MVNVAALLAKAKAKTEVQVNLQPPETKVETTNNLLPTTTVNLTTTLDFTNVNKLKLLSHSSIGTLNTCARKYEIYKLGLLGREPSTIDTAFGHAVGAGIASLLVTGGDIGLAKLHAFAAWEVDITWNNEKAKKSFYHACLALEVFKANQLESILEEWEVLTINGKPAVELAFCVVMPNGYYYRGFIDAVLIHKETRTIKVLEIKTTKANNVSPATYRNSFQGVGYGTVLDAMSSELNINSEFYVDYLVYQTGAMNYIPFPFLKTFFQRAKWLTQLQTVADTIDFYLARNQQLPMDGDSCYNFYRECPYYGRCEDDNEKLVISTPTTSLTDNEFADIFLSENADIDIELEVSDNTNSEKKYTESFDFVVSFEQLVTNQQKNLEEYMAKGYSIPLVNTDPSTHKELEITFD